MDFVEHCRKLISLDTTPSQGNWEAGQYLANLAQDFGLHVEILEEFHADQKQMNLIIRPAAPAAAGLPADELLMQTHLDTPDPGPFGLWAKTDFNPFAAHIIEGNLYGLGTADAKVDFMCKLWAMREFSAIAESGVSGVSAARAWRCPPVLVATFGEETGMLGALKLIRKNKIRAKRALIGEPSDMDLIYSGKGIATVEIRLPFGEDERRYRADHDLLESTSSSSKIFNGKAAHSSTPQLGDSAIKKMFEYLRQLPEDLTLMEVGGGVNFNAVPARAHIEFEPVSGHVLPMAKKLAVIYDAICDLEDQFIQYEDPAFNPPRPTLNIGMIRTHEDQVVIAGTCRITPSVKNEVYERWMRELAEVCRTVQGELRVSDYKRPYTTALNSPFLQGCLELLQEVNPSAKLVTQASSNEASLFSRVGIECVAFGAGAREGNVHTPDEHVSLADLQRSIDFYKKIITRFCL